MRKSSRFERQLFHNHNRRGLLPKSRFSRTTPHCRVLLAGALLLLVGAFWFILSAPHGGIAKRDLQDVASWEDDRTRDHPDLTSFENAQKAETGEGAEAGARARAEAEAGAGAGGEIQQVNSVQSAGDDDDAKAFEMSLPHNRADGGGADGRAAKKDDDDDHDHEEEVDEELCDRSKYPPESKLRADKITILVNGFSETRMPLLQKSLRTYSSLAFVHSVYILWGNTSTPENFSERWDFSSFGAPIYLVRQASTSLNARFLPRRYIKTRVVAVCDDDITVDLQSLAFALHIWREDEDRIVGFFPRTHVYDPVSEAWLYTRHYQSYSIMLTKFMILATEYLYRYTCEMPRGVKEYVDGGMNCEDIAMNFLASGRSGKGPVLVEGNARDWGDPRNSAVEHHFEQAALSRKSNHLQSRGECITAFQTLWKGMKLQYSQSKASADLENEIQCEKFGFLIDCDKSVSSRRDAARLLRHNVVSFSQRYAYATLLASAEEKKKPTEAICPKQRINAAILLAQSLRSSGTVHDLVLLLDPSCGTIPEAHVLYQHFDEVVRLNRSRGDPSSPHGKLGAWLLLEYAKVVFLEADSLVLANLDHLFQLPELTAAPQWFAPGKFSTGLLVLKPSKQTHMRLLRALEGHARRRCSSSGECLLNSLFDWWFQMPAENRLPARYNFPAVLSKELKIPPWFDVNRAGEQLGPIMVVRYGNAELVPQRQGPKSIFDDDNNAWLSARLKLFEFLQKDGLSPLENFPFMNWAPKGLNGSSHTIEDLNWPPESEESLMGFDALASQKALKGREAFVTVLWGDNQHPQFSVAGWAESFHHHHSFQSRPMTLLIVLSTLDARQYLEHSTTYFDEVRVVEPVAVKGRVLPESFALLHLWNQTDFDKLVYVAANSLFVENCNSLLDYVPFAAVTSPFPPDTFSTKVMSVQPDQQTYDLFTKKLLSYEDFGDQPVERFLNAHYRGWYQMSTRHRISPSYMINVAFESHLHASALPRKVLNFDLDWLPDEEANVTRVWKQTLCDLKPGKDRTLVSSLCGTM